MGKVIKIKKINALKRILGNVNSDSGMMNTHSGKTGKSVHDKTGMDVHVETE